MVWRNLGLAGFGAIRLMALEWINGSTNLLTILGGGLALVFARTETRTFFDAVWGKASAIYFLKGRIRFCTPDGLQADAAGSPSVLIAYGDRERQALKDCTLAGYFVDLHKEN